MMYLTQNAVEETFNLIFEYSSSGSLIVFDRVYSSILRLENKYYGEKAIYQRDTNYHLDLMEDHDSIAPENKYFRNELGKIITKINGTHGILMAK